VLIYKILLPDEWKLLESTGRFVGSAFDLASGYVHCSTREQVARTARRFFLDEPRLVVLALDAESFGKALRWEKNDDGTFPHVYAPVMLTSVVTVHRVEGPVRDWVHALFAAGEAPPGCSGADLRR
jgi:uncharacterized protein (DUF952 family)